MLALGAGETSVGAFHAAKVREAIPNGIRQGGGGWWLELELPDSGPQRQKSTWPP